MAETTLVGVPMYTLSRYSGMGESPRALREAGVARGFGRTFDAGDVRLGQMRRDRGKANARNLGRFVKNTEAVRKRLVGLDRTEMTVALGGECSMVVGVLAGLAPSARGRVGLVWIDAHGDFNVPATTPSGYIGGMCLAFACGRGPRLAPGVDRLMPLVREDRVAHLGSRSLDGEEEAAMKTSAMKVVPTRELRKVGAAEEARRCARWLDDRADWIVCHFDTDVVDPAYIPAVNYPTPGGLTPDEASAVLRAFVSSGKLSALDVAAYNAALDMQGESGSALVEIVAKSFR